MRSFVGKVRRAFPRSSLDDPPHFCPSLHFFIPWVILEQDSFPELGFRAWGLEYDSSQHIEYSSLCDSIHPMYNAFGKQEEG